MARTSSPAFRRIPAVDRVVDSPEAAELASRTSRPFVTFLVRRVLEGLRRELAGNPEKEWPAPELEKRIQEALKQEFRSWACPNLKKVINATGVILHTNLGRAPVGDAARRQLEEVASNYSNLEFDLARGSRGKRDVIAGRLLETILDCPRALVVNNNAAAVFLILNSLAEGGEVLISRGEMIEIGDSFRVPDILRKSGARLKEVGTTNKTHLSDYRQGFSEKTSLVLRVHPSNFKISGFTSKPSLQELSALCASRSVPLVEDLGSGCLIALEAERIEPEPHPRESLSRGADVVCFSGDKLLGGSQAGIIAGSSRYVQRIRQNPLFRALRMDKLALAVLESTLIAYLTRREESEIPVVRMIRTDAGRLRERASQLASRLSGLRTDLTVEAVEGVSVIGGGSTPSQSLPTWLLRLRSSAISAAGLEALLRQSDPPVLARLDREAVLLDLRTVFPADDARLFEILGQLGK
ncbi:MAG: L-seryl-tRNA(Sec) selenium transferase [Acidobacteriota bacterium]|nr:L-seryl-tRNA(Sec) selenium transferase [Acidobacteriota bacterium]